MKKLLLTGLICAICICPTVFANEVAEDYLDIAASYATEGNYQESLKYINNALMVSPNDAEILELRDTITGILNPAFKSIVTVRNPFLVNVKNAEKQGNQDLEYSILKQNADKGNFWAAYFLANKYRNSKDYSNALVYYQKAISLKPNYYQAYLSMGLAQSECMQYTGAIKNLDTYLKSNPKSDVALAIKANCQNKLNNYDEALKTINQAISIADNAEYKFIKGKILYNKGYYLEAKKIFEDISAVLGNAEIYEALGLCQYNLKQYADSLLNLDKAIILSNDDKNLNLKYNEVKMLLESEQKK